MLVGMREVDRRLARQLAGLTSVRMIKDRPFYVHLIAQMEVACDLQVPITGVRVRGGRPVLSVNPNAFRQLSLEQQEAMLEHEILHVVCLHFARAGNRHPGIWSIACDLEINQLIPKMPRSFKIDGSTRHNYFPDSPELAPLRLPWRAAAERYYQLLVTVHDQLAGTGGAPRPREQQPSGADQGSGDGTHPTEESQGDSPTGDQGPNARQLGDDGYNVHPPWRYSDNALREIAEAVTRNLVREAVGKSAGRLPGAARQFVNGLLEPKVDWRRLFRSLVARQKDARRRETWKRPNRRYGDEAPGYRRDRKLNVLVVRDTSGSISEELLAAFNSEILLMAQSGNDLVGMDCDRQIQQVFPISRRAFAVLQQLEQVRGRGGTSLGPPFQAVATRGRELPPEWGKHLRRPFDLIVYLTDAEGEAPQDQPVSAHTAWVITPGGRARPHGDGGSGEISWGHFIYMDGAACDKRRP